MEKPLPVAFSCAGKGQLCYHLYFDSYKWGGVWVRQARQVILRVELPSREGAAGPPSLVVLRLDHLSYSGAYSLAGQSARWVKS